MTESFNEPVDVGPAVGGDQSVQESDREHVITLLTAAHNEGKINATDRDMRISAVRNATTFDDLVVVTRDLVPLEALNIAQQPPQHLSTYQSGHPMAENSGVAPASTYSYGANTEKSAEQFVAIFSGKDRSGHWQVLPNLSALTIFGGVVLDMTDAVFAAQEIRINVFNIFGGLDITVPRGVEVRESVVAVFGGVDFKRIDPPVSGAPVIIIEGFVGFGGVNVKHRKKDKIRRQ